MTHFLSFGEILEHMILTSFPSFVMHGRLPPKLYGTLNKTLIKEIGQLEEIDTEGVNWSKENYKNGFSTYASYCQLHHTSPNFAELESRLKKHMLKYLSRLNWQVNPKQVKMTTCWANRMGTGCHHTSHNHPMSLISGVYYLNAPKQASPLRIEDPRLNMFMNNPGRKPTAPRAEQPYLTFSPAAGSFVIFESWMRHEVPPHLGKTPRFSISFNYEF